MIFRRVYALSIKRSSLYLRCIVLMLLLIPVWWVLGIDQFVFPAVIFLLFIIFMIDHRKGLALPPVILPALIFLLVYAVSGFFVVEKIRYFVFAYNFIQNISVVMLLIIVVKTLRDEEYLKHVVWTIFILVFLASVLGAAAILLGESMKFETPLAPFIPEAFEDSDFLRISFIKRVVNPSAYILGIRYPRVHSFFLHSNSFAQVLIVSIPLISFLYGSLLSSKQAGTRYFLRVLLLLGFILVIFNLLFTTDRTGIIGVMIGFLWWFFFWIKWPWKSRKNLYATIIIAAILLVFLVFFVVQYFDEIISARPGSLSTRMIIYRNTIRSWMDRPFFGWGVTRDIADVYPGEDVYEGIAPMGTHSTYLGILYRQGIAGLLVFIWFISNLWHITGRSYRRLSGNKDSMLFALIGFAAWGFIGNLVQGIFNMLDLVSASFHITWLNIALLVTASAMVLYNDNKEKGLYGMGKN